MSDFSLIDGLRGDRTVEIVQYVTKRYGEVRFATSLIINDVYEITISYGLMVQSLCV